MVLCEQVHQSDKNGLCSVSLSLPITVPHLHVHGI